MQVFTIFSLCEDRVVVFRFLISDARTLSILLGIQIGYSLPFLSFFPPNFVKWLFIDLSCCCQLGLLSSCLCEIMIFDFPHSLITVWFWSTLVWRTQNQESDSKSLILFLEIILFFGSYIYFEGFPAGTISECDQKQTLLYRKTLIAVA